MISRKYGSWGQFLASTLLIVLASVGCFFIVEVIGYRAVALILLLVLSVLAMLFDIIPVLVSALLSALIWNFFFIPPTFTFDITTPEDGLLFLMYFVIALINAVLTFKIRQFETKARDKEEKEKTIKLYNTLLNSLSHELRTPISTIIGAIDTIKYGNSRLSDETTGELYAEIEKAGVRLNRQVENLLSMSRLEAGILKPKLDWCDLNELIHNELKNSSGSEGNREFRFEPNDSLPLYKTDSGLIEQILHNIIHNTLEHTPDGTIIKVDVVQTVRGFEIDVIDNGKGFPENEIPLVFDKFYRIRGVASGGTGLGLSIVKGFTEALGGTVRLENVQNGGARFVVTIPAEAAELKQLEYE